MWPKVAKFRTASLPARSPTDHKRAHEQRIMKHLSSIGTLLGLIAMLSSCTGTQYMSEYDDVYYSPGDEYLWAANTTSAVDDYPKGQAVEEEYYDPEYRSSQDYRDDSYRPSSRYEDDDYYYSSRFRRFHRPQYSFGYYDSFYSNNYWRSYDPHFWQPRPIRPYFYTPGWGFTWNNQFGWATGYTYGHYDPYPFGFGYGYGYSPMAYNPYGYYFGNPYCPSYSAGGFANNDFYNNTTPVYGGQYNSMNAYSSSSRPGIGWNTREQSSPAEGGVNGNTVRPATDENRDARPASDSNSNQRPVYEERPRESTPVYEERPRENRERPRTTPRTRGRVTPPTRDRGSNVGGSSPSRSNSGGSRSRSSSRSGGRN